MEKALHWTIHDLDLLPDDGKRYEIVDGELFVSRQPDWEHQSVSIELIFALKVWNNQTNSGKVSHTPGLILSEDTAVIPDIVWISRERLKIARQPRDGKLHRLPELVVEILSPGSENARRDREVKLKLYSRYGAEEYWVVDWRERRIAVYRQKSGLLALEQTLNEADTLQSPLLPGFSCAVNQLFSSLE